MTGENGDDDTLDALQGPDDDGADNDKDKHGVLYVLQGPLQQASKASYGFNSPTALGSHRRDASAVVAVDSFYRTSVTTWCHLQLLVLSLTTDY